MEAKKRAEPWLQRKGEDSLAYYRERRWDHEEVGAYHEIRIRRSEIKETLALLRNDEVPTSLRHRNFFNEKDGPLTAPFRERYDGAYKAALAAARARVAQTPVDDEAWEQELARRRKFEEWRREFEEQSKPENCIINVR
jgi:hypothetical protein